MDRQTTLAHIARWARDHVAPTEQEQFRELAENELLSLHEGNYARYQVTPGELAAWRQVWTTVS